MALITANSAPVLSGAISFPRVGAWTADLVVGSQETPDSLQYIDDGNGTIITGTVVEGGVYQSRTHIRVVGGLAGLRDLVQARHYRFAPVGQILAELCNDAREVPSPLADPAVHSQVLDYWSRPEGTAGHALGALADSIDAYWRVLQDGMVWIGEPSFVFTTLKEQTVLDADPMRSEYIIAPDGLELTVGMEQSAGVLSRIEYTIGDTLRATYWVD